MISSSSCSSSTCLWSRQLHVVTDLSDGPGSGLPLRGGDEVHCSLPVVHGAAAGCVSAFWWSTRGSLAAWAVGWAGRVAPGSHRSKGAVGAPSKEQGTWQQQHRSHMRHTCKATKPCP
jgi:hypothetical protein